MKESNEGENPSVIEMWSHHAAANDYRSVFFDMRKQWNGLLDDYIVRERTWKILTALSLVVTFICISGFILLAQQNKVVPYVVEVDKLGAAIAVQRADLPSQVDSRIIRAELARWITDVRSVYHDAGAIRNNITKAYGNLRRNDPAFNTLNEYFSKHDPFERGKSENISVEINTAMPITGDTWQVQWTEAVHSPKGELLTSIPMQANLTLAIQPPTDESILLKNPMGIYITDFNWSKRL